jgi:hypothetical protein
MDQLHLLTSRFAKITPFALYTHMALAKLRRIFWLPNTSTITHFPV